MTDTNFISGLVVKAPNERAPEYVKAKLSIKREDLIAWLQGQSVEWINADIKVSQNGKWYAQIDTWKPEGKQDGAPRQQRQAPAPRDASYGDRASGGFEDDDIPFTAFRARTYL